PQRRPALADALARALPECAITGMAAGLHLPLTLPSGTDAAAVAASARRRGLHIIDLAAYRIRPVPHRPGLVLGFGNLPDPAVTPAVRELAAAIRDAGPSSR